MWRVRELGRRQLEAISAGPCEGTANEATEQKACDFLGAPSRTIEYVARSNARQGGPPSDRLVFRRPKI